MAKPLTRQILSPVKRGTLDPRGNSPGRKRSLCRTSLARGRRQGLGPRPTEGCQSGLTIGESHVGRMIAAVGSRIIGLAVKKALADFCGRTRTSCASCDGSSAAESRCPDSPCARRRPADPAQRPWCTERSEDRPGRSAECTESQTPYRRRPCVATPRACRPARRFQ